MVYLLIAILGILVAVVVLRVAAFVLSSAGGAVVLFLGLWVGFGFWWAVAVVGVVLTLSVTHPVFAYLAAGAWGAVTGGATWTVLSTTGLPGSVAVVSGLLAFAFALSCVTVAGEW